MHILRYKANSIKRFPFHAEYSFSRIKRCTIWYERIGGAMAGTKDIDHSCNKRGFTAQFSRMASAHNIHMKTIKSDYVLIKYANRNTLGCARRFQKNYHKITAISWWTTNMVCYVMCAWVTARWVHTKYTLASKTSAQTWSEHGSSVRQCVRISFTLYLAHYLGMKTCLIGFCHVFIWNRQCLLCPCIFWPRIHKYLMCVTILIKSSSCSVLAHRERSHLMWKNV